MAAAVPPPRPPRPSALDTHTPSAEFDVRLTNEDLSPLKPKQQTWSSYNIFAFWMSDVHSVGGYITAGSLFALGLSSWQVLVCLIIGITIVQFFCNLVAKPSQVTGTPYPVICRASFGVLGASIPALVRGLIAVAWYGIQTYLASSAVMLLAMHFYPEVAKYADVNYAGFAGLSALGWAAFMTLWLLQMLVFWRGIETIRRFIDWAGPAVYVVMIILAIWLVGKAGWRNISLSLGSEKLIGWQAVPVMMGAIALVVSYFSGPMLNFGDFSRYGKTFKAVKLGNFWGLPVNFLGFSLLTVITTSATLPVFGQLITDPVETVSRIDNTFAVVLGAFTFITATIGINLVANFVSASFDFSNLAPRYISWRTGGMIAAVASIFITPWNLYNNPAVIHYTIDVLGALIGPLFGILISDYYLVRRQKIVTADLYSMQPRSQYWYRNGYNPVAIATLIPSALIPVLCVVAPSLRDLSSYSWFIGMSIALVLYYILADGSGLLKKARL